MSDVTRAELDALSQRVAYLEGRMHERDRPRRTGPPVFPNRDVIGAMIKELTAMGYTVTKPVVDED
jgi:hypothetical protein